VKPASKFQNFFVPEHAPRFFIFYVVKKQNIETKEYQQKWLQQLQVCTQIEYQNKHYNIDQKDKET
jgi:hypothetical protein